MYNNHESKEEILYWRAIEDYSEIKNLINKEVADLWLNYSIDFIDIHRKSIRIKFAWLTKESCVIYLPFIGKNKERIFIVGDTRDTI